MRRFVLCRSIVLFLGCVALSAHASFSSIYIFGDSISTTTTNSAAATYPQSYYGKRYSNGRSWVEVLAQRQGFGANSLTNVNWNYSSNNLSFYGQYSPVLVTNINKFISPSNATNCLFVVWVNNADFVGDVNNYLSGLNLGPPSGTNLADWTTAINQHLTNHFQAITNLYAKGCRTLLAPNAVDITEIPEYNSSPNAYKAFVRQRIISFNSSYLAMLNQVAANYPGMKIYSPDIFSLLDNTLANASAYGLTNATYGGLSIDAFDAYGYGILANDYTNGPGTNYIFWDPLSPSARFHEVIADVALQTMSPVAVGSVTPLVGSNQLNIVNVPVGLNGLVLATTNLATANWTTNLNFASTNLAQAVFVTATNQQQFFRLKFPYAWSWP